MSFIDSILDGCIGEWAVLDFLRKQPGIKDVVDVRDDINYRNADVDFLIKDSNNQFTPIEVKTDFKADSTGNIAYELTTSGHPGCFEKTKAKFVYYYLPQITTFYVINVARIREYIRITKPPVKNMGDAATGYLLNINNLIENNVIIRTINIKERYEDEYKKNNSNKRNG